ncbi:MAG: guanylate kinase [Gammaproteobacteria bacterium]|jgi:guanylate kinase
MAPQSGQLFVVSAPSGAGKTSLVNALIESTDGISASVSHTTRDQRPGETEGEDYFFVDAAEFQRMAAADEFLEHAEVFGNLYGTSKAQIRRTLDSGLDLVLEIDWQGARSVRALYPETVCVFILPPSEETLRERLVGRGRDDPATIDARMRQAMSEMSHFPEYEYLLVNDDFAVALEGLRAIVLASRLQTKVGRARLSPVVANLLASSGAI